MSSGLGRGRGRGFANAPREVTTKDRLDFFTLQGANKIQLVPSATRGVGLIKKSNKVDETAERRLRDRDYAKRYQEEEESEMGRNCQTPIRSTLELSCGENKPVSQLTPFSQLSQLEEPSTIGDLPNMGDAENCSELYARYAGSFSRNYDPNLVITSERENILKNIEANSVLIIQGNTGCGKTTQVPQYILDDCAHRNVNCNIVVTQPRRIAAISISTRVAQERGVQLGTLVGYQIGMDSKTSPDTKITYMTTGVLLRKFISLKNMNNYTHVIIDEIHERSQDTDFLMMVVRKFLRTNSQGVRVIVMSATIDVSVYQEYFSSTFRGQKKFAQELCITGKPKTVAEYYLESLTPLGNIPTQDPYEPNVSQETYELVFKLICTFDRIEVNEFGQSEVSGLGNTRGTVLVFLPGYEQISEMQKILVDSPNARSKRWWILPLHSSITGEEQRRVFLKPQEHFRKIILSTNIAESSITVPDIRYVIDFCLTKNLVCDPNTNYSSLQLEWAAKSNCNQRKGRAGRVSSGRVYRLVTTTFYNKFLSDYGVPEMKRCPLELVVLNAKSLEMGEPKAILALTMDPPELVDIENAILALKEMGGLKVTSNGVYTPYDGDLTYLGKIMAALPLDVRLSKLIALGFVFGCLDDCIVIASSLSVVSFFSKPFRQELNAYKSRMSWADGSFSDCLAYLNAYTMWDKHVQTNFFKRPGAGSEKNWALTNFVQLNKLRETKALVDEINNRLYYLRMNYRRLQPGQRPNKKVDNSLIRLIAICGAFYPNYFVQEPIDEPAVYREISNNSPLDTIIVKGLPANHGILYEKDISSLFESCTTNVHVEFEDTKAYITFGEPGTIRAGISPAVYHAVKMRMLRIPLELQVFSAEQAQKTIEKIETMKAEFCSKQKILRSNRISLIPPRFNLKKATPPSLGLLTVELLVTEVLTAGHFWAQLLPGDQYCFQFLVKQINMYQDFQHLKPVSKEIELGMLLLAPFTNHSMNMEYHRGYVTKVERDSVHIFFVDYGNTIETNKTMLREISPNLEEEVFNMPAQAIECMLCETGPKITLTSKPGEWSPKATEWFRDMVNGQKLIARVYSVVDGILRVQLSKKLRDGQELDLNSQLKKKGFAEDTEESYKSRQDHDLRCKCENLNQDYVTKINQAQNNQAHDYLYLKPSDMFNDGNRPNTKIRLHGPSSPLEVSYVGMSQLSSRRKLNIDQESVNSVTLAAEPQNSHPRLLVASHVSLNSTGSRIRARHTTLMPHIKGLPALMAVLFAPAAEFRTDNLHTHYTGALYGLGFDKTTREPYYPDHDGEILFDVMFDHNDIVKINSVRLCLNAILGCEDALEAPQTALKETATIKSRELIESLISTPRRNLEVEEYPHQYKWGRIPRELRLVCELKNSNNEIACAPQNIFLPHNCVVLLSENDKQEVEEQHYIILRKLHERASRSEEAEINRCPLCEVSTFKLSELLMHLNLPSHMEKEEKFKRKYDQESESIFVSN